MRKKLYFCFGKILGYKRVDLLIKAAQALYDKGYHNFKVKIAGGCKIGMNISIL